MRIAFVAEEDPSDVRTWSGTPHHMVNALRDAGADVVTVGPLRGTRVASARRYLHRAGGRRYFPGRAPKTLAGYARQIEPHTRDVDLILSPGSIAMTKVRSDQPRVIWSDATFASMLDYYPEFSNLSRRAVAQAHAQEQEAIGSAALCVFSSRWAADSAIRDYGADPAKVRVIGFGANVADPGDVTAMIEARGTDLELLFIGANWARKGGDFAVEVARLAGAHLTVIGGDPGPGAPHVTAVGQLDKNVPEEAARLRAALAAAHFLIMPTRAECTPIAFCEANAFGVPCLSFDTGGVSAVIEDGRNGFLFDPASDPQVFADRIVESSASYPQLARGARAEYDARLNWGTSAAALLDACGQLLPRPVA